jgi:hypothetical protein
MSHGTSSSPSQENRSFDHPLPLVSTEVVNEQEIAFTLDTALRALEASQKHVGFLSNELIYATEQAELYSRGAEPFIRRQKKFANVYEKALEVGQKRVELLEDELADILDQVERHRKSENITIRPRDDASNLHKEIKNRKALYDKVLKEFRQSKERNNHLQKQNRSLQDENRRLKETCERFSRQSRNNVGLSPLVEDESVHSNDRRSQGGAIEEEQGSEVGTTVAETGAASMETSTGPGPWAGFVGPYHESRWLEVPEETVGFWKPSPEDDEQS